MRCLNKHVQQVQAEQTDPKKVTVIQGHGGVWQKRVRKRVERGSRFLLQERGKTLFQKGEKGKTPKEAFKNFSEQEGGQNCPAGVKN